MDLDRIALDLDRFEKLKAYVLKRLDYLRAHYGDAKPNNLKELVQNNNLLKAAIESTTLDAYNNAVVNPRPSMFVTSDTGSYFTDNPVEYLIDIYANISSGLRWLYVRDCPEVEPPKF